MYHSSYYSQVYKIYHKLSSLPHKNIYCTHQPIIWKGFQGSAGIAHTCSTRCQLEQLEVWVLESSEDLLIHNLMGDIGC